MAHILLVDDDPAYRSDLAGSLQKAGYTVEEARDGPEAASNLARRLPDLVLAKVVMPWNSGWDILRTIRANPRTSRVPVIYLATHGLAEDRARGLEMGAADYLIKPIDIAELELRVRNALERAGKVRKTSRFMSAGVEFSGVLSNTSLGTLLSVIDLESKTGILEVRDGDRKVQLVFQEGRLKRALLEGRESVAGLEAALSVMEWTMGQFKFVTSMLPVKPELDVAVPWLLMEAARRRGE